eukprot:9262483-Karenia_brevis.AAC.1
METVLTLRERREEENKACIGGMRAPWRAVRESPRLRAAGQTVRTYLEKFLTMHGWVIESLLDNRAEGWAKVRAELEQELVEGMRMALGACSSSRGGRSRWRSSFVAKFVELAGDPEVELAQWLDQ